MENIRGCVKLTREEVLVAEVKKCPMCVDFGGPYIFQDLIAGRRGLHTVSTLVLMVPSSQLTKKQNDDQRADITITLERLHVQLCASCLQRHSSVYCSCS